MNRQISFTASYNPYSDFYSPEEKIYKILFKAGHNIDHTHLNLLQTLLQEQIARFGQYIFKTGSFVTGGQYTQVSNATILNIVDFKSNQLSDLKLQVPGNWNITELDQTITLLSLDLERENTPEVYKLIVSKDTEVTLESNKHYTLVNSIDSTIKLTVSLAKDTQYIVFDEGVLFVNGYFILTPKQYTVLRYADMFVGFLLEQNIVYPYDDTSLLDNSQKDTSSLEGADRLQLKLELASYSISRLETNYNLAKGSFFEFLRLQNWYVIKDLTKTQYSKELSQMIERRTYDKSGNYTVVPFRIKIDPESSTYFKITIYPGKAYIFGNEFELLRPTSILLPRTTEIILNQSNTIKVPNCPYFIIPLLQKFVNLTTDIPISLYDLNHIPIGSAYISYIKREDSKYRCYLSQYSLENNLKLSDVSYFKDSEASILGNVESVVIPSEFSRLVTLNPDEKISAITKIEELYIQKIETSLIDNKISFTSTETLPTTVDNYIAFDADNNICAIESVDIFDDFLFLNSSSIISKVIISGVKKTINSRPSNYSPNDIIVSKNFEFSKIIDVDFYIKRVESIINNNENIIEEFSFSPIVETQPTVYLKGTRIKYTGTKNRSGNVQFNLILFTNPYDEVRLDILTQTFITPVEYNLSEIPRSFQFPFSTTIDVPYSIKRIETATNNQENIVSQFSFSPIETNTRITGTRITYTGSTTRTGNILFKFVLNQSTDNTIHLNNLTLDLRQSSAYNFPLVEPNTPFKMIYDVSQSRYDKLVLNAGGEFSLLTGTPHPTRPLIPKDKLESMTLYELFVPANNATPEDIGIKYIENQRYTMRDIGKIEKRIENLEYYNLLTLLEKNTADQTYNDENGNNRFKNGFLVDNFKNYKGANFISSDCIFSLDLANGILRPSFTLNNINLTPVDSNSPPLISCTYTEEVLIDQSQASTTLNVNPYECLTFEGRATLNPPLDFWVDIQSRPEIVELDLKGATDVYTTFKEKGFTSEWGSWDNKILKIPDNEIENAEKVKFENVDLPSTKRLWQPNIDPTCSEALKRKYDLWVSSKFTAGFNKAKPDGYIFGLPAILVDFKGQIEIGEGELVHFQKSKNIRNQVGGTAVSNIGFQSYIREQDIRFDVVGLKPSTAHYITFSDDDITNLCFSDTNPSISGDIKTNSEGQCSGIFKLPANRFKTGQYTFKIIDTLSKNSSQVTSFAVTDFIANGMNQQMRAEHFLSTREPQTTTESVHTFNKTVGVFDTSALDKNLTISLTQTGLGTVKVIGYTDKVVLKGVAGSSVYYTSMGGINYRFDITPRTEGSKQIDKLVSCDGLDFNPTHSDTSLTVSGNLLLKKDTEVKIVFGPKPSPSPIPSPPPNPSPSPSFTIYNPGLGPWGGGGGGGGTGGGGVAPPIIPPPTPAAGGNTPANPWESGERGPGEII